MKRISSISEVPMAEHGLGMGGSGVPLDTDITDIMSQQKDRGPRD